MTCPRTPSTQGRRVWVRLQGSFHVICFSSVGVTGWFITPQSLSVMIVFPYFRVWVHKHHLEWDHFPIKLLLKNCSKTDLLGVCQAWVCLPGPQHLKIFLGGSVGRGESGFWHALILNNVITGLVCTLNEHISHHFWLSSLIISRKHLHMVI